MLLLTENSQLHLEEITTGADLESLRYEWWELWERSRCATPFQSPAWLIPWWRNIGEGVLMTLAIRENDRLIGLAPLYLYTQPGSGQREVFPVGIATTDYLDILAAPGRETVVMNAALAHLAGQTERWDICEWPQLMDGSVLLGGSVPDGWRDDRSHAEPCPILRLPLRVDQLGEVVPGSILHNLHYYRRRAEKVGHVAIEQATAENWEELYDALLALHRARWISRGEGGVLAEPCVQAAHRESIPEMLRYDLLRLYGLRIDERIVACYYGFADTIHTPKRAFYYLGGFDPEFEKLSLGTLLVGHAIEEAVREGAAEFDFLRGQESYKYLWGASDRVTWRRRLQHGPIR